MQKVYITVSNLNKFVRFSVRNKSILMKNINRNTFLEALTDIFPQEPINDILNSMTTDELADIYFYQTILEQGDTFLKELVNKKDLLARYIAEQNKQYVYTTQSPCYHSTPDCEMISSDFYNIKMPEGFQSNTIKQWVMNRRINKQESFSKLNLAFQQEFLTDKNLEEIKAANSGNDEYLDDSLDNHITHQFSTTSKQLRFLLNDASRTFIQKYKYISFVNAKQLESKSNPTEMDLDLIEYFHAKEAMKKILKKKLLSKYNTQIAFSSTLLENLGFKSCGHCKHHVLKIAS